MKLPEPHHVDIPSGIPEVDSIKRVPMDHIVPAFQSVRELAGSARVSINERYGGRRAIGPGVRPETNFDWYTARTSW